MKIAVGCGCHQTNKFNRINKFLSEIHIQGAVATAPYELYNA